MSEQQSTNLLHHNYASNLRPKQNFEIKHEGPEMSENIIEYIIGEDGFSSAMPSDSDGDNLSWSTVSNYETPSYISSDSSSSSSSETPLPVDEGGQCSKCGGGPYRSFKLHLLHCVGARKTHQCVLCKNFFPNEAELQEHHMPLYLCNGCGQVFPKKDLFSHSHCHKPVTSLVLFCSESLPKACNICKSFFISEKALLLHVTKVHSSVVSTKICIVTDPSLLTDKKKLAGVLSAHIQSGAPLPIVPNQVVNGNVYANQTRVASWPNVTGSSLISAPAAEHEVSAPSPVDLPSSLSTPSTSSPAPYTVDSDHDYSSTITVLAMFENKSHQLALMKRMNTGWRSKPPCPCRQCGAIFRQPSFIISHRYLHRGRRSHRCRCGRVFKHQLHLLRHCIQHAEALNYICVCCGNTFTGARRFAKHLMGKAVKKSRRGQTIKRKVKTKCSMPFICECGLPFLSPSAFIWHQIKNRTCKIKIVKERQPTVTFD